MSIFCLISIINCNQKSLKIYLHVDTELIEIMKPNFDLALVVDEMEKFGKRCKLKKKSTQDETFCIQRIFFTHNFLSVSMDNVIAEYRVAVYK